MMHCSFSQVLSERKFFIYVSWSGDDGRGRRKWKFKRGGDGDASSGVVKITANQKDHEHYNSTTTSL